MFASGLLQVRLDPADERGVALVRRKPELGPEDILFGRQARFGLPDSSELFRHGLEV